VSFEPEPILEPGIHIRYLTVDGFQRSATIYVPPGLALDEPQMLVLMLHGNPPADMSKLTRFNDVADSLGFIMVYPHSFASGQWAFACDRCNPAADMGIDDVKYFSALLDLLEQDLVVDRGAVFVTGFSMGGMMTVNLICQLGDRFVAAAPVGAIAWDWHMDHCGGGPQPLMWHIGSVDNQFPWEGKPGPVFSGLPGDSMKALWLAKNGCDGGEVTSRLPDLDPSDGTTVTRTVFTGCREDFEFYWYEGMDHNWPGSPHIVAGRTNRDVNASSLIARFFMEHRR